MTNLEKKRLKIMIKELMKGLLLAIPTITIGYFMIVAVLIIF